MEDDHRNGNAIGLSDEQNGPFNRKAQEIDQAVLSNGSSQGVSPCSDAHPTNPPHRQGRLLWEQRSFSELIRLAWPITLSTLSYSVMTLVDTLLVGHLGPAALAGVGLGGTVAFAILCFLFGVLRGAKTLVSQAVGAQRHGEVGAYLGSALGLSVAFAVVSLFVGQLVGGLLPLLASNVEAGEAASLYLRIRLLGAPFVLAYVALREVRYGQGDATGPMRATILANVVNIALAYVLVRWYGLGVAGAAWATVVAHGVELLGLVLSQRSWGLRAATREHLKEVLRVGIPTGVQFVLEVGSFVALASMISLMSEVEMAAHQIVLQISHFSFLPAMALAEAASVLAGQAIGARRPELVLRVAHQGGLLAALYNGLCTVVMVLGASWIVSRFTSEPALISTAVNVLYVAAAFQIFDGANVVARATLRGTGDVRVPAYIAVLTAWVLTPPLTWLLGLRLGLGAFGGWLGLCAEIVLCSVILWYRLERGAWRRQCDLPLLRTTVVEA